MSPLVFRRFSLFFALLALSGTVSTPARAEPEMWGENALSSRPDFKPKNSITQQEFAEAATSQFGFLSSLRGWRDTLKGSGARRDYAFSPLKDQKIGFSLGSVATPLAGSSSGVTAQWNAFEVGTTAQPQMLSEALARFDSVISGEKVAPDDLTTQMTWLRARPLQSQHASLEISLSQAKRDTQSGQGEKWLEGRFQNARAHFSLPASWSLNGDFTREQLETQTEAATSWGVDASGPIVHPWGVARAKANWREIESGYATLDAPTAAPGGQSGALEVAQDVAHGPISGSVQVAATTRERQTSETARAGDELTAEIAQSQAQMRLSVTPNLALLSSGSVQIGQITRALSDPLPVSDGSGASGTDSIGSALLSPSQSRELSQRFGGDFGLEWKFSKALSVAVSTGATRQTAWRQNGLQNDGNLWNDGPRAGENRLSLEMRHQTRAADFRVSLARKDQNQDALGNGTLSDAQISQWRIEAARRLIGSVHLKTIVDLARDAGHNGRARRLEAQLQLARDARFDARYREGNLPGLLGDNWSSAFAAPDTSMARQWSARFNAGSAASGSGLGLALEYARDLGASQLNNSWRIGVQYK